MAGRGEFLTWSGKQPKRGGEGLSRLDLAEVRRVFRFSENQRRTGHLDRLGGLGAGILQGPTAEVSQPSYSK